MANADNLIRHRFTSGASGNPAGRPRGSKNVSTQLKKIISKVAPDAVIDTKIVREFAGHLKGRITVADAIACRLAYEAVRGNMKAVKEILDRTEGKARQAIELSGGDSPVELVYRVEYVDEDPNA